MSWVNLVSPCRVGVMAAAGGGGGGGAKLTNKPGVPFSASVQPPRQRDGIGSGYGDIRGKPAPHWSSSGSGGVCSAATASGAAGSHQGVHSLHTTMHSPCTCRHKVAPIVVHDTVCCGGTGVHVCVHVRVCGWAGVGGCCVCVEHTGTHTRTGRCQARPKPGTQYSREGNTGTGCRTACSRRNTSQRSPRRDHAPRSTHRA